MKIFCIGRNYADHARELANEVPEEPVVFMKPETALLRPREPFYIPSFSQQVQYECELVIKIDKEGKFIEPQFAHKYYSEVTLGIDFTARDIQNKLKAKGLPWELAKAFNGSAALGEFVSLSSLGASVQSLDFSFSKNSQVVQQSNTSLMLFQVDYLISFISRYFTLKKGDLLYTGTPKGVGDVAIGDDLMGTLAGMQLLHCQIR